MDSFKLLAHLARRPDSTVARVVEQPDSASSLSPFALHQQQFRRKILRCSPTANHPLVRSQIEQNFELLRGSGFVNYDQRSFWKTEENKTEKFHNIVIQTPWTEGTVLSDIWANDPMSSPTDFSKSQSFCKKLKIWSALFWHLGEWHERNVLHGNLKPENLLINDMTGSPNAADPSSQKKSVTVSFLDGGFRHLLFQSTEKQDSQSTQGELSENSNLFWQAPEAIGVTEGAYTEASDIYSLGAIMAKDCGFLSDSPVELFKNSQRHTNSSPRVGNAAIRQMWPLFCDFPYQTTFIHNEWLGWKGYPYLLNALNQTRLLLRAALEPRPFLRSRDARSVSLKLTEILETLSRSPEASQGTTRHVIENLPKEGDTWNLALQRMFENSFKVENKIVTFLRSSKNGSATTRLWYSLEEKDDQLHQFTDHIAVSLQTQTAPSFHFKVRPLENEYPFSTLDRLVAGFVWEMQRQRRDAFDVVRGALSNLRSSSNLIFQVLPSLRKWLGEPNPPAQKLADMAIQARHEGLHLNLLRFLQKLLDLSQLSIIVIEDLTSADSSSLDCLLQVMRTPSTTTSNVRWILGVRSAKWNELSKLVESVLPDLSRDTTVQARPSLKFIPWQKVLNELSQTNARFLAFCTVIPESIMIKDILDLSTSEEIKKLIKIKVPDFSDDTLGFSVSALRRALSTGILQEVRRPSSGLLTGYQWASEELTKALSLLLTRSERSKVSLILSASRSEQATCWSESLRLVSLYCNADMKESGHAAFKSLMATSEAIPDTHTAIYLISRFQNLEGRLERQDYKDSDSLIPRIRERVGDLSWALGNLPLATRYYSAVSLNMINPKRRGILALKAFFPSEGKNRYDRTLWFENVIKQAYQSKLIIAPRDSKGIDPNLLVSHELRRLSALLRNNSSLETSRIDAPPLTHLVSIHLSKREAASERLPYSPQSRSVREPIFAQFLRSALGWIDNDKIFPHLVHVLHMTLDQEDGPTIIHSLFSILLCSERSLRFDLRAQIFEALSETIARSGNQIDMAESILLRAWFAYFYEGNIAASERATSSLRARLQELPKSIRLCCNKMTFILALEQQSPKLLSSPAKLQAFIHAQITALNLEDWNLGKVFVRDSELKDYLNRVDNDFLISSILSEKIDQALYYQFLTIEEGQNRAEIRVLSESRKQNSREWFADPRKHNEFMPESIARYWSESMGKRNLIDQVSQDSAPSRFSSPFEQTQELTFVEKVNELFNSRAKKQPAVFDRFLPENLNWSQELAFEIALRYEYISHPDPEKLCSLALCAAQTGMYWTASRIAHRAGIELPKLVDDLNSGNLSLDFSTLGALITQLSEIGMKSPHIASKDSEDSEEGLAFVLQFLQNLQTLNPNARSGPNIAPSVFADFFKRALPPVTSEADESMAHALKTAIRRLEMRGNSLSTSDDTRQDVRTGEQNAS